MFWKNKTWFCWEIEFLVQFWHLLAGRYVDSKVDFLANSNKMMLLQCSNGFSFTQSKISISTSCPYKKCEHFQVAMWWCRCRWRVMVYWYLSRIILLFDFHHLLQFSDLWHVLIIPKYVFKKQEYVLYGANTVKSQFVAAATNFFGDSLLRLRPSQKMKKLSDQKYLLATFIGSHKTLKNTN